MARDKSEEEGTLRELCTSNGLDVSEVLENGGKKTKKLEMFFFGFPRMCGLQHFPHLRVLRIVNQSLERVEGLSACPLLEELWIAECKLKRVEGLSQCLKLCKLYLYQNHITSVQGLAGLDQLSTLWLNSNEITDIKGLSHLRSLQNLNLAENSISSIDDSLSGMEQLQILNLSANRIQLLEDVYPLFSLPHLEQLSFSDPAHGPNPFSSLCNYSTHLLYHLPQLQRLDGRDVTHPHLRNVIQLAVFRKRQFYRMRSQHVRQEGAERKHQLLQQLSSELVPLQRRMRELKRLGRGGRGLPVAADRVRDLEDHCQRLVDVCAAESRVVEQRTQLLCRWLDLELATAGNVSCVVGTPSDPWYQPCVELVEQRAAGEGQATVVGVCQVENRSTRRRFEEAVHRERQGEGERQAGQDYEFLLWKEGISLYDVVAKGKFPLQESRGVLLTSCVNTAIKSVKSDILSTKSDRVTLVLCQVFPASSSGGGVKEVELGSTVVRSCDLVMPEYLVELSTMCASSSHKGSVPELPDNDRDILSQLSLAPLADGGQEELTTDGLQEMADTAGLGVCDASDRGILRLSSLSTSATSSVTVLDLSFNCLTSTQHITNMPNLTSLDLSYNNIHSLEGMTGLPKLQTLDLSWNSLKNLSETSAFLRSTTPTLTALDLRSNKWEEQIDSTSLRLYLIGPLKLLQTVNGSKVTAEEVELALRTVVSSHLSMASVVSKVRTNPIALSSLSLLTTAEQLVSSSKMRPSQMSAEQSDWWKEVTCVCANDQKLVQIKAIRQCPNLKWACFRGNHLQHVDGLEECPQLEELTLEGNWLRSLASVCPLKHLVRLFLSHNLLTSLSPLGQACLHDLQLLDVSNNRLTSLEGVEGCPALLELYAGGNLISNTREVLTLKKLSSLLILNLHGNPLDKDARSCRLYAAYHLPSLKAYDGAPLEAHELSSAKEMYGGRLNAEFILERTGQANFSELRRADYPGCGLKTVQLQPEEAFGNLMSLNLEQNQLTSMSGLIRLPQLKVLCLNHNRVERLAPPSELGGGVIFPSLQVLHLAYNQLSSLLPLQLHRLTTLRALFLQGNQLTCADGLQGLCRLTELVLDHNKIRSIGEHTFASQSHLLVLHIEENRLRELSNLGWLLHLEKLFVGMNRIQEFSDTDELCALKHLNEVSLLSNPVARRLHYRTQVLCRLPNVTVLDGVGVSEEERARIRAMVQDQEPSEGYGVLQTASGPLLVTNMTAYLHDGSRTVPHQHQQQQHSNATERALRK